MADGWPTRIFFCPVHKLPIFEQPHPSCTCKFNDAELVAIVPASSLRDAETQVKNAHDALIRIEHRAKERGEDAYVRMAQDGLFTELPAIDENDPTLMFYARDDGDGFWAARFRPDHYETFSTEPRRFSSEQEALDAARQAHELVRVGPRPMRGRTGVPSADDH